MVGALMGATAMGVAAAAATRKTGSAEQEGKGDRRSTAVAVGLGVLYLVTLFPRTIALVFVLGFLTRGMLQSSNPWSFLGEVEMSTGMLALSLMMIVVVGPIAEELAFRGYFLPWLAAAIGRTPALLVTSISFGLLHYSYGAFALVTILYGLVLGWARLRSRGLLAPVVLHIGVNLIASADLWFRWGASG